MIDITVVTRINRPVDMVFAYVVDVANESEWHTDPFHVRSKPSMGVSDGTAEVVDFEPNRRQVLKVDFGRMRPRITHLVEWDDGTATVTRRIQFELPGMMRLLQPLVRRMVRKRNAAFMTNLKRLLERA